MAKAKLLIAGINRNLSDQLEKHLKASADIALCGVTRDGRETLTMILNNKPDIVLMDLVMPHMDGIAVLEKLKESPSFRMPYILMTSVIGQERVMARAAALRASYYMIKPYNLDDLLGRILLFAAPAGSPCGVDFHERLKRAVLDLGVPPNQLGFPYIVDAVEVLWKEEPSCSITKIVYPAVARLHTTTPDCVESVVRKTIHRIYEKNSPALHCMTGQPMDDKRLSNGKFLTVLMEKVRDGVLGVSPYLH